ncbi:MAG TPA: hypothetical protein VGX72_05475 [Solirubrobacteraceae bacterium]|jgi:hypothetical protein|nr:hypothetical protein [Solirubrobacteraceae bacterium]
MSGPMRRVIPVGYHICKLSLVGESPLLMSSGEADRDSDTFKAFRSLSKVRSKSDEQESRLRELEWYTRLYYDEKIGVYIPGKNIKELLRSAATKWRKGEDIKRSLVVPEYRIPLIYDGPKKPADLWAAGFRYTAMVANSGAGSGRVPRTRPCFDEWALECEIAYDPEDLDFSLIEDVVGRSPKYGLGDYRPEFGAFSASIVFEREQRLPARANGAKPRDKKAEKAVKTMARRIKASA